MDQSTVDYFFHRSCLATDLVRPIGIWRGDGKKLWLINSAKWWTPQSKLQNLRCTAENRNHSKISLSHQNRSFPSHLPTQHLMASRRLALNLAQGMRSRAAINAIRPLKRGFATPVTSPVGAKTQTTTLKNGLTVSFQRPIGLINGGRA